MCETVDEMKQNTLFGFGVLIKAEDKWKQSGWAGKGLGHHLHNSRESRMQAFWSHIPRVKRHIRNMAIQLQILPCTDLGQQFAPDAALFYKGTSTTAAALCLLLLALQPGDSALAHRAHLGSISVLTPNSSIILQANMSSHSPNLTFRHRPKQMRNSPALHLEITMKGKLGWCVTGLPSTVISLVKSSQQALEGHALAPRLLRQRMVLEGLHTLIYSDPVLKWKRSKGNSEVREHKVSEEATVE